MPDRMAEHVPEYTYTYIYIYNVQIHIFVVVILDLRHADQQRLANLEPGISQVSPEFMAKDIWVKVLNG